LSSRFVPLCTAWTYSGVQLELKIIIATSGDWTSLLLPPSSCSLFLLTTLGVRLNRLQFMSGIRIVVVCGRECVCVCVWVGDCGYCCWRHHTYFSHCGGCQVTPGHVEWKCRVESLIWPIFWSFCGQLFDKRLGNLSIYHYNDASLSTLLLILLSPLSWCGSC